VRAFPTVLSTLIMALVSVRRLQRFLLSGELRSGAVERRPASSGTEAAVLVRDSDFLWSDGGSTAAACKPTLSACGPSHRLIWWGQLLTRGRLAGWVSRSTYPRGHPGGNERVRVDGGWRVVKGKQMGTVLHFRTIRLQSRGFKQI
jgi:hypothetical protein